MVLHMPAGKLCLKFRGSPTCSNSVYPDYDIYFTINILLCRAFVEIESHLVREFVAFYSMINSIVLFCVTMVICYDTDYKLL